ncbi:MAG: hypothetical protein R3B45_14520, partial [Bdellovibrionota bacterium]
SKLVAMGVKFDDASQLASSRAEIEKKLAEKFDNQKQRVLLGKLNEVRKHFGITGGEQKLRKPQEEPRDVRYVSLQELQGILNRIDDPIFSDLVITAFVTGGRLGEILALRESCVIDDFMIVINRQLKEESLKFSNRLKRGGIRKALIIPTKESLAAITRTANLQNDVRFELRKAKLAERLTKFYLMGRNCSFEKLTFNDLRHSYVIHMLGQSVSLSIISKWIGDSISTCEKYYSGYEISDEASAAIYERLKSNAYQ